MRVAAALVAAFVCSAALGAGPVKSTPRAVGPRVQRTLSFDERVNAQAAIERVYYAHQIGATKPFDEAVPRAMLDAKVRKYLEQTIALQTYWKTAVTDETLQRELERMAQGTRMPERLQEVFAALGNDTFLIKECVARPALVDRLTHNFYAFDPTMHVNARAQADAIHQLLASGELSPKADHPNRTVSEMAMGEADAAPATPELPMQRRVTQGELQKRRAELPSAVGEVSRVKETRESFSFDVILNETTTGFRVANYDVAKTTWDSWWQTVHESLGSSSVAAVASTSSTAVRAPAVSRGGSGGLQPSCADDGWDDGSLGDPPDPRMFHTAVWTGSQMLIWGGENGRAINTGARYDPATDSWSAMSTAMAPLARGHHTAVWTGSVMMVWGGYSFLNGLDTGSRYNPATDTWTPISTSGAPSGRFEHTAVWTGHVMVVWGGRDRVVSGHHLNTGGRYDPSTDSWSAISTVGAPTARSGHTSVWTGSLILICGGAGGSLGDLSGKRYDPASNTWTPMSFIHAPRSGTGQTAVWTGSLMIVWGGYSSGYFNTGARYNPVTDRWTATSTDDAPSPRANHHAVWTGHLMLIWGAGPGGGRYDVATNHWTPMSTTGAPSARVLSTAVWAGGVMIEWGGAEISSGPFLGYLDTGARYNPWTDSWTPTSTGVPSARSGHTGVWTGSQMIVWGGARRNGLFGTGGMYDPATDSWSPTSTSGAPSPRIYHTAVWAGSRMVVWGGLIEPNSSFSGTGGCYDPVTDTWTPTSTTDAPSARNRHAAISTGSRMVVWGGVGPTGFLDTGGRYDPATDRWTPTSTSGAPSPRMNHTALWTGTRMVVWGGFFQQNYPNVSYLGTGGRYDPTTDTWTPTSTTDAPSARDQHSASWTGNVMVVWGGYFEGTSGSAYLGTGGRYDPVTDHWTSTSTTGAPAGRVSHTAVSTGSRMIVWGGGASPPGPFIGAWYDPTTDHWTKLPHVAEPTLRSNHSAVWTGAAMIIWGGNNSAFLGNGGRYSLGTSLDDDCDRDGVSAATGDCDDHDASVYPGAPQLCDGINNDCANAAWPDAFNELDFDEDGFRGCQGDCDDDRREVYPNAPQLCDGINNNCDPSWPYATEADSDRDGYRICDGDCDDTRSGVRPGRAESCDGLDNDCDGVIDNGGDVLCEANGGCVKGRCGGLEGCTDFSLNEGPCDDGSPCSIEDRCDWYGCYGTPVANGTPCDDGDFCTVSDACSFGYCQGGTSRNCGQDSNDCNGREYCDYVTSACETLDVLAGCEDGNICTTDNCDSTTGCFSFNNVDPCDDGDACTDGDTCGDGLCVPGSARNCDDYNPCTVDSCDPQIGCVHTPEPEFTYCDDYNACTGSDYCDGFGTCISPYPPQCDDHVVCTEDYCDPEIGCAYRMYPAGTSCSDGDACNGLELCDGAGGCAPGTPPNCDDNNPCTTDFCSSAAGCIHSNNANACNDGNACTRTDVCVNGACTGSNPVICATSDQCHTIGVCNPASGACSNPIQPNGTVCNDGGLCTNGETCQSGTCTPAFSGLNQPNPRSNGYYMRLCIGPHSGDQLTNADATCVGQVATTFAGSSTVADICAVLRPQHPNDDPCDRTSADLMVLALNVCRARVCTAQSIDSQCGDNGNVGQSLAESDAILLSPSRNGDTCAHAKCLDEEINTGRALELNSLGLRREGSAIRLDWRPPYLDDGTGHPSKYHVWRRVQGSLAPFTKIGTTTNPTHVDTLSGSGAFEYEVTAVMN